MGAGAAASATIATAPAGYAEPDAGSRVAAVAGHAAGAACTASATAAASTCRDALQNRHGAATRDLDAVATAAADRTIAAGTNPAIAAVSTGPAIERAENIGAGSARTTAPAVTRCTAAPAAAAIAAGDRLLDRRGACAGDLHGGAAIAAAAGSAPAAEDVATGPAGHTSDAQ